MKSVPIAAAKRIADEFGKDQVIVLSWSRADGKTWVTTYGRTLDDCAQASEGGNRMKRVMGWPEDLCKAQPARAKSKTCKHCGHSKQNHATGHCDFASLDRDGKALFACICTLFQK